MRRDERTISAPKRVLIVDDEEDLTWSISRSLAKDRDIFQVICVNSGDEALDVLRKFPIDLVVSDLRMPGTNGLDLLATIRKNHPQTKVIVMTAYGSQETKEEVNKRGSTHYIEKPFDISYLRQIIWECLREQPDGFEGRVAKVRLEDIIQLNCLSRNTLALFVSNNGRSGVIYFQDGEIVHAECGESFGEGALYSILQWEQGNFISRLNEPPRRRTITREWRTLLNAAQTNRILDTVEE